MKRRARTSLWCLSVLAVASACGSDSGPSLHKFATDQPVALEDALLYLDAQDLEEPQAVIADVTGGSVKVQTVTLAEGEIRAIARPGDSHEALLLTSGRDASLDDGETRDAVNAHLSVLARGGERARYELDGRFTELVSSEDGRFVIAYAPSGAFSWGNAVAIVDLQKAPESPGATRTVNIASTPTSFAFAPVSAGGRRLLVVRMPGWLELLDLEHLERGASRIPLSSESTTPAREAGEILFHGDRIFVQVTPSTEVLVLQLTDDPTRALGFTVAPLEVALGSQVQDLELVEQGDALRLLAVSPGQVSLVEAVSGASETLSVGGGYRALLEFEGRAPIDDEIAKRALLYAANGATTVGFVDLAEGAGFEDQEVEQLDLGEPLTRVIPLLTRKLVIALHESGRLSLIDLEARTASPINTPEAPTSTVLDEARARLWVTTELGQVGSIDLVALEPSALLLNAPALDVLLVPGAKPHVAVVHAGQGGHVTLLDAQKPARTSARELIDFLWTRLFD